MEALTMEAIHWRVYRGAMTLSARLTEAVLGLETALLAADSSSELRKVLDKLYDGIADARDLRPHILTYAAAVFEGAEYPAPCPEGSAVLATQHGALSFSNHVR
jgi:hypothetical protein